MAHLNIQLATSRLCVVAYTVLVMGMALSEAASPTMKLGLVRRERYDHGAAAATTSTVQLWQRAMQKSRLRAAEYGAKQQLAREIRGGIPANSAASLEIPLSAGSGADFVATLAMGTPPVSMLAIVDTGSSLVWRQCLPCLRCYPEAHANDVIFDPALSSTYKTASCSDTLCSSLPFTFCNFTTPPPTPPACVYQYSYGTGADFTFGEMAFDILTLPDSSGIPVNFAHFGFGCGHLNHGDSNFSGAGGIVGLGRGASSLVSQLNITQFSYCLLSFFDSSADSSPLFLGPVAVEAGTSANSGTTPILTNPLLPSFYYLKLKGISVAGELLNIPAGTFDLQEDGTGGFIIDSGTTITSLPQLAYSAVLEALQANITAPLADPPVIGFDLCYANSGSVVVPPMMLHFEEVDVDLPVDNYFVDFGEVGYCLVMAASPSGSISILGNYQQQNFHIVYDLEANVLSFSPASCGALA